MDDAGAYFFPHADFYQAGDSERGLSAFIIGAWGMVVMIIAFLDGQPVRQFERRRWCSLRAARSSVDRSVHCLLKETVRASPDRASCFQLLHFSRLSRDSERGEGSLTE